LLQERDPPIWAIHAPSLTGDSIPWSQRQQLPLVTIELSFQMTEAFKAPTKKSGILLFFVLFVFLFQPGLQNTECVVHYAAFGLLFDASLIVTREYSADVLCDTASTCPYVQAPRLHFVLPCHTLAKVYACAAWARHPLHAAAGLCGGHHVGLKQA
jgi:hypothetical protein